MYIYTYIYIYIYIYVSGSRPPLCCGVRMVDGEMYGVIYGATCSTIDGTMAPAKTLTTTYETYTNSIPNPTPTPTAIVCERNSVSETAGDVWPRAICIISNLLFPGEPQYKIDEHETHMNNTRVTFMMY